MRPLQPCQLSSLAALLTGFVCCSGRAGKLCIQKLVVVRGASFGYDWVGTEQDTAKPICCMITIMCRQKIPY